MIKAECGLGNIVIATSGLSIPKIGVTDFVYRIARQLGLRVIKPQPGLVLLTFNFAEPGNRFCHWQAWLCRSK